MSSHLTAYGINKDDYQRLFDILNKYATGVQPAEVANEFAVMSEELKQSLAPLALLAAVGARRTIEQDLLVQQFIQKVPILRSILNDRFMIQNKVNFTKLYVLGNLLMQSGSFDDITAVKNYQTKIQGKSLLTSDITKANVSDKKKEIIKAQINKYNINEFLLAAKTISEAFTRVMVNSLLVSQSSSASSAVSTSSSSSTSAKPPIAISTSRSSASSPVRSATPDVPISSKQ